VQAKFGRRGHVFVDSVNGAKIAQVPIENRAAFVHTCRDGGITMSPQLRESPKRQTSRSGAADSEL